MYDNNGNIVKRIDIDSLSITSLMSSLSIGLTNTSAINGINMSKVREIFISFGISLVLDFTEWMMKKFNKKTFVFNR